MCTKILHHRFAKVGIAYRIDMGYDIVIRLYFFSYPVSSEFAVFDKVVEHHAQGYLVQEGAKSIVCKRKPDW
jgi:hypothetical protein